MVRLAVLFSLILLVLFSLILLSYSAQAAELVGSIVPPFPDGLSEKGGICIGVKPDALCEQAIGEFVNASGKHIGIFTSRFSGRGENGQAHWLVSDVIAYPQFRKGYILVWGDCRYAGMNDSSISAIIADTKQDIQELLPAVGWARRVDRNSGKFVNLNPKNVDCHNTANGSD